MTDELVIANPESAGRVFDTGEDVRAFLLEHVAPYDGGPLEDLPMPYLVWVNSETRSWNRLASCRCRSGFVLDDYSDRLLRQQRFQVHGNPRQSFAICACMGRFIE